MERGRGEGGGGTPAQPRSEPSMPSVTTPKLYFRDEIHYGRVILSGRTS